MSSVHKIALGTVQWGLAYGIANQTGRPDAAQIGAMLMEARERGIAFLDTARAYGEAERILGEFRAVSGSLRVFTKTPPLRADFLTDRHVRSVSRAFRESLKRLHREHVDGLLVHNADNLLIPGGERLWALLQALKAEQRVGKIGVSVYHPEQLSKTLDRFRVDVAQLPFNIYDQRFAQTGVLGALKKLGVEVHSRSTFLQGLLLLIPKKLPRHFECIREHQMRLHRNVANTGQTLVASALRFSLNQGDIDYVVVGCEILSQLREILDAAETDDTEMVDLTAFALSDEEILDPSRWSV